MTAQITKGSPNVIVNGIPIARVGDLTNGETESTISGMIQTGVSAGISAALSNITSPLNFAEGAAVSALNGVMSITAGDIPDIATFANTGMALSLPLTLPSALPTQPNEAATKAYVDSAVSNSGSVVYPITVQLGGTGANNAANARINLGLATVANTGSYNDLLDQPTIPVQVNSDWNASSGVAEILNKPVLFSGSYTDLTNKPTLGTAAAQDVGAFANSAEGSLALTAVQPGDLATVATSGQYDDLAGKPTIPAAQVNSDWNASSGVAEILHKPTIPTALPPNGSAGGDLSGTYPNPTVAKINGSAPATVATSGSYTDLTNKPTIPAAQVNSDWNASSGVAEILHKPTIPTALPPNGAAGGDLSGTYPNPTVAKLNGVAASGYALLSGAAFTANVSVSGTLSATNGVSAGSTVAANTIDLSHGLVAYSNTYGFCVTVSALNVVAQGNNAGSFTSSGFSSQSVTDTSDAKFKTDIHNLRSGLDIVKALVPRTFFNEKTNRHDIGFIAQEVATVIPEVVFEHPATGNEESYLTLAYNRLTAPIVAAVQEIDKRLTAVENRLDGNE